MKPRLRWPEQRFPVDFPIEFGLSAGRCARCAKVAELVDALDLGSSG
jgi:hypothetical protein